MAEELILNVIDSIPLETLGEYIQNPYLLAFSIVLFGFILSRIFVFFLEKVVKGITAKTKTTLDDLLVEKSSAPLTSIITLIFGVIAAYTLPDAAFGAFIASLFLTLIYILATMVAMNVIDLFLTELGKNWAKKSGSQIDAIVPIANKAANLTLILIAGMIILSQWGIEIAPILAGMGIAGLALSFALQDSLKNIFGGASLMLDGSFKVGDKVIQTKNEYEKDIINGDIGFIRSINLKEKTIYVDFENPDRLVEIPLYENDLELAYTVTCHKFQGSEAPIIIIPIHRAFGPMIMQRNWLYTAISRAKKVCILVGQREEIAKIIKRDHQQRRFTRLAETLR